MKAKDTNVSNKGSIKAMKECNMSKMIKAVKIKCSMPEPKGKPNKSAKDI